MPLVVKTRLRTPPLDNPAASSADLRLQLLRRIPPIPSLSACVLSDEVACIGGDERLSAAAGERRRAGDGQGVARCGEGAWGWGGKKRRGRKARRGARRGAGAERASTPREGRGRRRGGHRSPTPVREGVGDRGQRRKTAGGFSSFARARDRVVSTASPAVEQTARGAGRRKKKARRARGGTYGVCERGDAERVGKRKGWKRRQEGGQKERAGSAVRARERPGGS